MKKADRDIVILEFKNRYINYNKQKELAPNHVVNDYISWLYTQWTLGLINLSEYKSLIKVNILEA